MQQARFEGIALKNLNLPTRLLVAGGLNETRDFLYESGLLAGLDITPVLRSRFYAEVGVRALRGSLQNVVDDQTLVSSLSQSFSQRIANIRTFQQVRERLLMPPVMSSLAAMQALQRRLGGHRLYANLYTEGLSADGMYNAENAPFIRAQTLTADLLVKNDYHSIDAALEGLRQKGIEKVTYDSNAILRPAQVDAARKVSHEPLEVLERLIQDDLLGQFVVSLARGDIRYPRENSAKQLSYDQAAEILSGNPKEAFMGTLPDMLKIVTQKAPETPIVVNFDARRMAALQPGLKPQLGFRAVVDYIESKRMSR